MSGTHINEDRGFSSKELVMDAWMALSLGVPMPKSHYKFVLIGSQMPSPEYIVDVESMDIFPVGWCEANAYNLTPPHKAVCKYTET